MGKPTDPSLAFEVREDMSLIVLKHNAQTPTDLEWQRYLEAFAPVAHRLEQIRILVLTDGGHPVRRQQAQMNALLETRSVRTAVVSSSMATRFVISILTFANPGIRGFASSHLREALEYLGLNLAERAVTESIAKRLSRTVAPAAPRA